MKRKMRVALLAALISLAGMTVVPMSTQAAALEFTLPIQKDFDKTKAAADSKTASAMNSHFAELQRLLAEDDNLETRIKALQHRNEEAYLLVRKMIKEIDARKLAQLEDQVKTTRERYKRLFDQYAALNKQISAVKPLKNKTINALLKAQADIMKPAVQLAREDIRAKEAALKTAKAATAQTAKAIRATLSGIDPLKVQIRSQRSAARLPRKSLSPAWTNFKHAIKKNEARHALDALKVLASLSQQIIAQQKKIYALETKIGEIIAKAKAQMPKI